ncbi:putative glycylpeptide n-tetradecanoyltransferase [Carp edema virus]|nr:putative glycylpeptide n-tetradecanoyltransferase [Carp edema virus]
MSFWKEQPVTGNSKFDVSLEASTEILSDEIINKDVNNVKKYTKLELSKDHEKLPKGFYFETLKLEELDQLFTFLKFHYIRDASGSNGLLYSKDFLTWYFSKNSEEERILLVTIKFNNKIMGFISGIPFDISFNTDTTVDTKKFVFVNFLSVHKKLRNKKMAPMLIEELRRRVGTLNLFQALFSSTLDLSFAITKVNSFSRILDIKKTLEFDSVELPASRTMTSLIKKYKIPKTTSEKFTKIDSDNFDTYKIMIQDFLESMISCCKLRLVTSEHLINFYFNNTIIQTYIKLDKNKIIELISFYCIDIFNGFGIIEKQANLLYCKSMKRSHKDFLNDILVLAKSSGAIILSFVDILDYSEFTKINMVKSTNSCLGYYAYNWKTPSLQKSDISLISM